MLPVRSWIAVEHNCFAAGRRQDHRVTGVWKVELREYVDSMRPETARPDKPYGWFLSPVDFVVAWAAKVISMRLTGVCNYDAGDYRKPMLKINSISHCPKWEGTKWISTNTMSCVLANNCLMKFTVVLLTNLAGFFRFNGTQTRQAAIERNWKVCLASFGSEGRSWPTWEFGLNKFASLSGSSDSEKESKAGTYNNTKALEQNPPERLVQSVQSSGMKCLLHLIYVLIYDWFRSSRLCCNFSKCILTVACCDTVPQLKTRFGPQVSSKCCRFLPGNPDESKCLDSQAKEPASKYMAMLSAQPFGGK